MPVLPTALAPPALAFPTPATALEVWLRMEPEQITPGEQASAVISVRNGGSDPATGVVMTDDVRSGAEVRSAFSDAADCSTSGPQAVCQLAEVPPGETVTMEVRMLVAGNPAPEAVSQRVQLDQGGSVVATRRASTPVTGGAGQLAALFDRPGAAVMLATTIALVLSARPGSRRGSESSRR